jgi:DNA polymerase-3 subunit beta
MKMICHREGLLAACQLASVAVPSRELNPILRNFKLLARDSVCTLLATDLELSIRLDVRGVQVQEAGEAVIPAAKATAILRESFDDEIILEADSTQSVMRGKTTEFVMPGEDASHYPDVPVFAEDKYHEIPAGVLRMLMHRTAFAAAKESARYSMTGVLCELEEDTVRLVATDGRRLAVAHAPATAHGKHSTKGQSPVIPSKAIDLIERNLQDPDEVVKLSLRPNEALIKTERAMICTRLVEGRYPNYRDVYPKKVSIKLPIEVGPFQAAVRQAAVMMDEETRRVVFNFSKKTLTLQAQGKESGRSKVEMPVDFDGKDVSISFNPAFVIDMLKTLPGDSTVILELVDASTVGVFKAGDDYTYLVMPLT